MDGSLITAIVIIIAVVLLIVGIAMCACLGRGSSRNGQGPIANGTVIYYTTVTPSGDIANHEERIMQLHDYVRQRHEQQQQEAGAKTKQPPTPKELADALMVTIASKLPGHVLCFFDPHTKTAKQLDLEKFIVDPEQIRQTSVFPLIAVPMEQLRALHDEELVHYDALRKSLSMSTQERALARSASSASPAAVTRSLQGSRVEGHGAAPPKSLAASTAGENAGASSGLNASGSTVAPASLPGSSSLPKLRRRAASTSNVESNGTGEGPNANATARDILDPPGRRLPIMTARVYPLDTHIHSDTLIAVTANRYVDPATHEVAALPVDAVHLLDAIYFRWKNNKTVARSSTLHGFTAKVELRPDGSSVPVRHLPADHDLMVARVSGPDYLDTVVVAVPGRCRVCWSADGAWHECTKPLLLDVGKWCLKAESLDHPGEHTHEPKYSSRVYIVEAAEHTANGAIEL